MKTNNKFFAFCVFMGLLIASAVIFSCEAQNNQVQVVMIKGEPVSNDEVAIAIGEASTCLHWEANNDGLRKEIHGGWFVAPVGAYEALSFNSTTGVNGKSTAFGGGLGLGYKLCKTHLPVAFIGEVRPMWFAPETIEGLKITKGSLRVSLDAKVEACPHSLIRPAAGFGIEYTNTVSKAGVGETGPKWRGNQFRPFVAFEATTKIFSVKKTESVEMLSITGKKVVAPKTTTHEVTATIGTRYYLKTPIYQEWEGNTLKSDRSSWQISASLRFHF